LTLNIKILKTVAIIPARKGSKRLPRKNIRLLDGLPLIVHSINYAKANSGIIDRIIVSTDDEEVKRIAKAEGVEVIERPQILAQDLTPTIDVLRDVLNNIDEKFDDVILLQPTNPLRPKNLISRAYKEYREGKFQSLMTITRNHQKFGKINNSKFEPFNYKIGDRGQDLEPLYFENGLLYITKSNLISKGQLLSAHNCAYIVDHVWAKVDIDTMEDFEFAEFLIKKNLS
jgi:CMP-N-acetylneuraminic acid synthetase